MKGASMVIREEDKEFIRFKLTQAREAYEEAKGLLAAGADLGYVVNSVYYAFYYPALALLQAKGVPAAMQSVSIALFEKELVQTGEIDRRYHQALRKAFELKPKCSTPELKMISKPDVEALLVDAGDFLDSVAGKTGMR
jgi:uncharacterized protein (UPF0332 family)